jgi:predicted amidophosphoribosyltransferase
LSDLKALLPEEITYDEIRFVLAARNVKTRNVDEAPPSEIETKGPDRAHVVWQMGEKGTREDVPTLIETLKDTDGNVRRLAASALGKIKDTRAVTPLIQLLNDDKPQVRQYAIKALGEIGSPEAKSALEQIADDAQEKDYNRQSALHALKSLSTSSEETAEDSVHAFLSRAHPKPLRGPWRAGFALDFHSKFVGSQHVRTELGELIYRFKYAGDQAVGETLAARLADFIRAHPELRADVLIPVPSTKKDRAYDPVPTLARLIAARTDLVLNETALVKARATEPQKAMVNLAQKSSNVAGAFRVTDPGAIRGKRVLLLDDFYDSGATLAEATRVLLNAGAREVVVLTVTKTIHTD